MNPQEERRKNVIRTIVVILTILGLLTAVTVVAANLVRKTRYALSQIRSTSFEPLGEADLTAKKNKKHSKEAADDGCSVSCAD